MKMKIFLPVFIVLLLLVAAGLFVSRSDLIDVDGYAVETVIKGSGQPTVIFESGFTGGRLLWLYTQLKIAGVAKSLVYERAGLGRSAPRPEPRTATQMADELHAILEQTELPPPYLLVGHSAGGMYMKTFASKYRDQVAGLVFVDAATPEVYERWQSAEPDGWTGIARRLDELGAPEGTLSQLQALPQTLASLNDLQWPEVPATIITATRPSSEPLATQNDMDYWLQSHRQLAAGIPGARHIILDNRNHVSILFDSRIADEIAALVRQAGDN